LEQTSIHSADFRFELYPWKNDLFSVTGFYKYLDKPIETLQVAGAAGALVNTYRNGVYANNLGVEIEVKKDFGFIHPVLEKLSLYGNFTYIYSRIVVENGQNAIYSTKDRPLQNQSPWIINGLLSYEYDFKREIRGRILYGFALSVAFNYVGPRIELVSLKGEESAPEVPDTYYYPAPQLDIIMKQKFWIGEFSFKLKNLLNMKAETKLGDNILNSESEGIEFSGSYKVKF